MRGRHRQHHAEAKERGLAASRGFGRRGVHGGRPGGLPMQVRREKLQRHVDKAEKIP